MTPVDNITRGADTAKVNRVKSSPTSSEAEKTYNKPGGRPWTPMFLRWGPLSGLACMMMAVLSILVSLGVLLGSRGASTKSWSVEPSAILAICTAIANQAMRYAAFQGVMIAWWTGALRGSTIKRLHKDWRAGTTILGAISAGPHMGVLGLACIFSTLVAVDGPLLQKATHVASAPIVGNDLALNISILPELPSNLDSGYVFYNATGPDKYRGSNSFNQTIPTGTNGSAPNNLQPQIYGWWTGVQAFWLRGTPLSGAIRGCPADSHCRTNVKAPALAVTSCASHEIPVDYNQPSSYDRLTYNHAPPLDRQGFIIDITLDPGEEKEKVNVVTGYYSRTSHCSGAFKYTACTLESAVGLYEVTVHGDTVTSFNAKSPTIIALSNNTQRKRQWDHNWQWYDSTLAGIAMLGSDKYGAGAVFSYDPGYGAVLQVEGSYFGSAYQDSERYAKDGFQGCVPFLNPAEDIFEDLNRLMFYTGFLAGTRTLGGRNLWTTSQIDPGIKPTSTVYGHTFGQQNLYSTDLRWFFGAAAIEVLCIMLVLPTYFGWWRLGRPVSFSPIEIAKVPLTLVLFASEPSLPFPQAFEAPILADVNSNSSGRDIANMLGDVHVQYGTVFAGVTHKRKLALADISSMQRPRDGDRFET